MNRWKMNKLGFLNFWLYDQEEFSLHDGHILLRGSNAAGKSITTQSFIPFLLDGDKSPQRLDPFGSRERKMEFYLLGDNEREESTGYLYLEFRKPGMEEYRTIGVGMRAQKGKGIDFWGFCLCDGRRIGPGGLLLYEKMGRQNLPLSKQKLRGLIGSLDCWAESQVKYKEMVNRHIFGYEDIRQYDQLIELLIKVRAPKLSKDFRPTRVKEILNQSLQVLTDDDLSAMVSTMEQMDALEDTMQSYQAAIQAARMVRNEYNRYNQYILGKKGDAYLKALNRTRSLNLRVQDAQAQCASLQQQLDLQEERQRQSGERLDQARARRDALGEDTLSAKREQLRRERENCTALAERLKQGETQLQRLEDGINQREGKLRDLKTECDSIRSEVRRSLRELDDQNTLLLLEPEHSQYVRALQAERPDADQGPVLAALRQRSRQIGEVLNCLRQVEAAKSVYDSACQALDMAESAVREQEILTRNAQTQEREERDKLLEEFTRWRDRNVQLGIPQDTWLELQRALTGYRSPADWSLIRNQIDECTRKQESMLRRDQLKAEEALSTLAADQRELERRLRQIKDQPEPVPPRRDQIQATRLQLAMQGIPCAPFYELIDFAPGLPQASRDLLEAQLLDAGLLDALVVPEEHLPAVRELLAEYPDRFLLPGPAAAQPLEDIVLDHAGRFPKEAQACLRAISRSDLNAETALLPDGRFRCGMIRGRSHAGGPAGFVGAAARAANRQRQIEELESHYQKELPNRQAFNISTPRACYITRAFTSLVSSLDNTREIDLNYKETNSERAIINILQSNYNLGIIRYQTGFESYFMKLLKEKDLKSQEIWEFEYVALMDRNNPLAKKKNLKKEDFRDGIEIVHGDPYVPSLQIAYVRKAEFSDLTDKKIYIYERGTQYDLLRDVPCTFMWVSPLPEDVLQQHNVVQKHCEGLSLKYKDVLIYRSGYRLTPIDEKFIEELNRAKHDAARSPKD